MRTVKEVGRNYSADIDIPSASIDYNTTSVTTNTTITQTSGLVTLVVTCSSTDITIYLPTAAANEASYNIIKVDSTANKVIIDPDGSETIDGASTMYIYDQWNFLQIQSDGTNWVVTNEFNNEVWT